MKRFRGLNSKGDTIIEVLIVLAVLSLAFVISYATANRGLIQSRNAEEHSEALGMIDNQVELLRAAFVQQVEPSPPRTGVPFCMNGTTAEGGFATGYPTADAADDSFIPQYPSDCRSGFYNESVFYNSTSGAFDFRVRWDGLGDLGRQQEELNYKINPSSLFSSGFITSTGFSWKLDGTYYDGHNDGYDGPNTCMSYAEDPYNPAPENEDKCDPPGPPPFPSPPDPCYGYQANAVDHGINIQLSPSAMYARRDFINTYDISNSNAITSGNISVGGQAYLTINFNQYQGDPVSASGPASSTNPGTLPPPANWNPDGSGILSTQPYAFKVEVFINGTLDQASTAPPYYTPSGSTLWTTIDLYPSLAKDSSGVVTGATPTSYISGPLTLPAGVTNIHIAWLNNESYQNGQRFCTPNQPDYDPDLQINYIQLASSPSP